LLHNLPQLSIMINLSLADIRFRFFSDLLKVIDQDLLGALPSISTLFTPSDVYQSATYALLSNASPPLLYSDYHRGQGAAFHQKACAASLEGIVSKRADAPYAPDNRGLWLKVKCLHRKEFVVVGWTA
jgi:hypothetical protein